MIIFTCILLIVITFLLWQSDRSDKEIKRLRSENSALRKKKYVLSPMKGTSQIMQEFWRKQFKKRFPPPSSPVEKKVASAEKSSAEVASAEKSSAEATATKEAARSECEQLSPDTALQKLCDPRRTGYGEMENRYGIIPLGVCRAIDDGGDMQLWFNRTKQTIHAGRKNQDSKDYRKPVSAYAPVFHHVSVTFMDTNPNHVALKEAFERAVRKGLIPAPNNFEFQKVKFLGTTEHDGAKWNLILDKRGNILCAFRIWPDGKPETGVTSGVTSPVDSMPSNLQKFPKAMCVLGVAYRRLQAQEKKSPVEQKAGSQRPITLDEDQVDLGNCIEGNIVFQLYYDKTTTHLGAVALDWSNVLTVRLDEFLKWANIYRNSNYPTDRAIWQAARHASTRGLILSPAGHLEDVSSQATENDLGTHTIGSYTYQLWIEEDKICMRCQGVGTSTYRIPIDHAKAISKKDGLLFSMLFHVAYDRALERGIIGTPHDLGEIKIGDFTYEASLAGKDIRIKNKTLANHGPYTLTVKKIGGDWRYFEGSEGMDQAFWTAYQRALARGLVKPYKSQTA